MKSSCILLLLMSFNSFAINTVPEKKVTLLNPLVYHDDLAKCEMILDKLQALRKFKQDNKGNYSDKVLNTVKNLSQSAIDAYNFDIAKGCEVENLETGESYSLASEFSMTALFYGSPNDRNYMDAKIVDQFCRQDVVDFVFRNSDFSWERDSFQASKTSPEELEKLSDMLSRYTIYRRLPSGEFTRACDMRHFDYMNLNQEDRNDLGKNSWNTEIDITLFQ